MANAAFVDYRNARTSDSSGTHTAITNSYDLITGDIKMLLIDSADHTVDLTTNIDHADITGAAIVATSPNLASKTIGTVAAGVFDCGNVTFSTVTGDQSEEIIVYQDSGTSSTSPLLVRFDTFSSGMPVTPNGNDIVVTISASGLFVG